MASNEHHEFPWSGPVTATLKVGAGTIAVFADERANATIAVSPADGSEASRAAAAGTKVEFEAGQLRVETPERGGGGWLRRGGQVRVELRLPVESRLHVQTGSADVSLDGRLAEASLHTGSGDATIERITGDLSMNTGSGDLRATEIGGSLRVHAGSGDITAHAVRGPVAVETSSGDVTIDAAISGVRARTASGDIRIRSVSGAELVVKTASGDVNVGVPTGTRVWLDLATASGSTRSDLAVSDQAPAEGAQLSLTIRTASGDINVHRVLAEAA